MIFKTFFLFLFTILCFVPNVVFSQSKIEVVEGIEIHNFDSFQHLLNQQNDTTYVINFWATWCKPCVEELPYFESLLDNYKEEKMQMILVSFDFPNALTKRLIPFIKTNKLQSKVILLHDPNSNSWIPKVDKNWSGAIPATYFYRNNKNAFFEKSFNYEALEKQFLKFLN